MILSRVAPLLLAVVALAGCNKSDSAATPKADGPVKAVAAPAGTTWAEKIVVTDEGVRMGNPDAPIKVIEYGSYTCPHCRDFQAEGHEVIERDYVNSGKISFEYRNMIRDPWDLTAAVIAHCAPPEAFFAFTTALFANQNAMVQQIQSHSQAELEAIGQLPPDQRFPRMAEIAGLVDFAKQRGVSEEKLRTCLADKAMIEKLTKGTQAVTEKYPQFPGTPSFILNGTLLDQTASWPALQARLRDAGA
ncbi:MAG: thioredoxin domain-containing protein [Sphingobium sp.]|nr:thioredoxin domain-containing protein [Sphingobium sp.]